MLCRGQKKKRVVVGDSDGVAEPWCWCLPTQTTQHPCRCPSPRPVSRAWRAPQLHVRRFRTSPHLPRSVSLLHLLPYCILLFETIICLLKTGLLGMCAGFSLFTTQTSCSTAAEYYATSEHRAIAPGTNVIDCLAFTWHTCYRSLHTLR